MRLHIIRTSLALAMACGLAEAQYPPLGVPVPFVPVYPPIVSPAANPQTPAKVNLGKILFWDEQVSADDSVACGTCHAPEAGGADPRVLEPEARHPGFDGVFGTADDRSGSPGVIQAMLQGTHVDDGTFYPSVQVTPRRAPGVYDLGSSIRMFWDGRLNETFLSPETGTVVSLAGAALENLALVPMLNDREMSCLQRGLGHLVTKLQYAKPLKLASDLPPSFAAILAANPSYGDLFHAAFGTSQITGERISKAIAAYLRTLRSDQTPFDAFVAAGGVNNSPFGGLTMPPVLTGLTPNQFNGLQVFVQRCLVCHTAPIFGSSNLANPGLNDPFEDPGRASITNSPVDFGRLKIPGLRNVGLREAFGLTRSGNYESLEEVVDSYMQGGTFPWNTSPQVLAAASPVLSATGKADLVDFLRNGLTDPRVAQALPPFDHPTLASQRSVLPQSYGTGHPGAAGVEPQLVAKQPPVVGSFGFTLGISGGQGGSAAVLALSTAPAPPGLHFGQVPLHISPLVQPLLVTIGLQGQGAGNGMGSISFPIPDQQVLEGMTFYGQWFVVDPAAQGGLSATQGFSFTML